MSLFSGFKKKKNEHSDVNAKEQLNKTSVSSSNSLSIEQLITASIPQVEEKTFRRTCPNCGSIIVHSAKQFYEVTKNDQSGKEKLLSEGSEVFKSKCPKCGLVVEFAYPVQYIDVEKKLNLYLMPEGHPDENKFLDNVDQFDSRPGFTTRLVADGDELVDKIRVFEEGLDDHIVEICKVLKWADLCESQPKYANASCYAQWFLPSEDRKQYDNFIAYGYEINGERDSVIIELPTVFYERVNKFFEPIFAQTQVGPFEVIDKIWADDIVDVIEQSNAKLIKGLLMG